MKCPVCGGGCVKPAEEILATKKTIFRPCPACRMRVLDKRAPLPSPVFSDPCSCGKRFIDEVFSQMYAIMVEEGNLARSEPLGAVGTPLVDPGFVMDAPPFLPARTLVLFSNRVTKETASRLVREVPELKGVVKTGNFTPGISRAGLRAKPRVYELLAGCDVRADIFPVRSGSLICYKQQSCIHIEFPRPGYPKIRSVEEHAAGAGCFVDACAGVGTLGLAAAAMGVPRVVLNDAWYASAFWSAVNLEVNSSILKIDRVKMHKTLKEMQKNPVAAGPVKIADAEGVQQIEVYQGDLSSLKTVVLPSPSTVTAIDLFDKADTGATCRVTREWGKKMGGTVFVP